jgi:hypothetical protein
MRNWVIVIGIVVILLIGGYFVLSFFAVKLIEPQLRKVVGPGFTLAEIKVRPTYLSARRIQYEDPHSKKRFFQVEEMRMYPSLLSLFKGPLRIRKFTLQQPSFFFYRSREGVFLGPWTTIEKKEKGRDITDEREKKAKETIAIQIDRFQIQKGSIDFEDMKVGDPPGQIRLRELDSDIRDIQYPIISAHSLIELKGKMAGKTKDGDIDIKGWIDFKTMDMETSFKVRKIEVKTFEPYYRKKVSAEIDSGYMDMDAKIAIKKKWMDVPGQLKLVDFHMKEGGGTVLWIPAKTLASLLKHKGDRIQIQFHMKGSLDDPKFNLQETFLTRIALSLAEAIGIPIKGVGEALFGGAGKGAKGFVEELKSIEELLRKRKEKRK